MRNFTILLLLVLTACLLAACGLLNSWLGSNGVAGANTPAAQEAAHAADWSIWNYIGQLFGVAPTTPQGPPQGAQTAVVFTVGATSKHIARGVKHVAKATGAGVAHAVRTVRGTKQPGNPG